MTGVYTWSTTASENVVANTGITWDEGMAPAAVNNSARATMVDLRTQWNDASWFQYGLGTKAVAATYASSTSVTLVGSDATAYWTANRRVKAVGSSTGTIYGSVSSSSYNGGTSTTTVNFTWDSGSLANESLTIYAGTMQVTGKPIANQSVAGLGTAATVNTGTSGATIPLLNGANTWSTQQINTVSANGSTSGYQVSAAIPSYGWRATGQSLDNKQWDAAVSGTSMLFRTVDDANSGTLAWLTVARSGVASATMNFGGNVGINKTPSFLIDATEAKNGVSIAQLANTNAGGSAQSGFQANNQANTVGMMITGQSFTPSGLLAADMAYVSSYSATGGLLVYTQASAPIIFGVNSTEVARFGTGGAGANFKLSTYGAGVLTTDSSGNVTAAGRVFNNALGNPTANTKFTLAHSFGALPSRWGWGIRNTTGEFNWAIGDVVTSFSTGSTNGGASLYANSTEIGVTIGSNGINVQNKTTGGGSNSITTANWQVVLWAEK